MPTILVRHLSEKTYRALKQRAAKNGNSMAAEIRAILDAAVRPGTKVGLGTALHEVGRKYGGWDLEIKRDKTPARYAIFE